MGWTEPGFDTVGWSKAREMVWDGIEYERAMGWGPHEAFPTIEASDLPHMLEREIYAGDVRGLYAVTPDARQNTSASAYTRKRSRPPSEWHDREH